MFVKKSNNYRRKLLLGTVLALIGSAIVFRIFARPTKPPAVAVRGGADD